MRASRVALRRTGVMLEQECQSRDLGGRVVPLQQLRHGLAWCQGRLMVEPERGVSLTTTAVEGC